jgi:hypothetical protein
MLSLRKKLGADSILYQEALAMGPTAQGAGMAKALNTADSFLLGGLDAIKAEKYNIGLDMANVQYKSELEAEKKKEKFITININGGVTVDNMDSLLDKITTGFRARGLNMG